MQIGNVLFSELSRRRHSRLGLRQVPGVAPAAGQGLSHLGRADHNRGANAPSPGDSVSPKGTECWT